MLIGFYECGDEDMSKAENFFWDGYLHWARVIDDANPRWDLSELSKDGHEVRKFEPVFIQLAKKVPTGKLERLNKLYEPEGISDDASPEEIYQEIVKIRQLSFLSKDDHVFDLEDFFVGLQHHLFHNVPFEFFVYRVVARTKRQHEKYDNFYAVMDVGAPAIAQQQKKLVRLDFPIPGFREIDVIGAVIDNDIGYLNRRFRTVDPATGDEVSRFAAIWLQAREQIPNHAAPSPQNLVHIGRVLLNGELNTLVGEKNRSEAAIYREINSELHLNERFRREPLIDTHGTAVADVAYGGDFEAKEAISDLPLLGVQLPPEAAVDTTGTYSESYIVQAVRWICARARQINPSAKLVINISYGVLAGQKDGGKFLEAQIAHEVLLAEKYRKNGKKGQEVHVVYAFGNSYNSRQVALVNLEPGEKMSAPNWTIHPDNPVPAFMEIRALTSDSGTMKLDNIPRSLKVKLTSPDGTLELKAQPKAGEAAPALGKKSDAPCRVYHVPERHPDPRPANPSFYNVAIAPTRRYSDKIDPAPPGEWEVELENESKKPIELVLQIQRGDTAPGFSVGGRQSHFVGRFEDVIEDGFPTKDVTVPLTNAGTISSYATAREPAGQLHSVGAKKLIFGSVARADYSAKGAPWTAVEKPSESRIVDRAFTYGVRAAGTYSGTTTRLSGTSAAAALASRDLI